MESKPVGDALIEYVARRILQPTELTNRNSLVDTWHEDVVIPFGGNVAIQQSEFRLLGDQAYPNGVADPTTGKVQDQACLALKNHDVQSTRAFRPLRNCWN